VAAEDAELPFCWPRLPATTESLTISKLSLPLTFLPLAVKGKERKERKYIYIYISNFNHDIVVHCKLYLVANLPI